MATTTRIIRVKEVAGPAGRLLSLATCRRQCEIVPIDEDSDGVQTHPDDDLLLEKLDAAVDFAEDFTGRAINLRTFEIGLDEFPAGGIELPRPPLVEVVTFYAGNDSDGLLDQGLDYVVDDFGTCAIVTPVVAWPRFTKATNGIRLQFRAGYASEEDPDSDAPRLPPAIRSAILLVMAHLYENREDSTEKALLSIPTGATALLRPKRVRLGFA